MTEDLLGGVLTQGREPGGVHVGQQVEHESLGVARGAGQRLVVEHGAAAQDVCAHLPLVGLTHRRLPETANSTLSKSFGVIEIVFSEI